MYISGDHTEAGLTHAITDVLSDPADDYFVFLLSDANLADYGSAYNPNNPNNPDNPDNPYNP